MRYVLSLSFLPELWSMRTKMVAPREGGNYADESGASSPCARFGIILKAASGLVRVARRAAFSLHRYPTIGKNCSVVFVWWVGLDGRLLQAGATKA